MVNLLLLCNSNLFSREEPLVPEVFKQLPPFNMIVYSYTETPLRIMSTCHGNLPQTIKKWIIKLYSKPDLIFMFLES